MVGVGGERACAVAAHLARVVDAVDLRQLIDPVGVAERWVVKEPFERRFDGDVVKDPLAEDTIAVVSLRVRRATSRGASGAGKRSTVVVDELDKRAGALDDCVAERFPGCIRWRGRGRLDATGLVAANVFDESFYDVIGVDLAEWSARLARRPPR
jgi:hypothetical protein